MTASSLISNEKNGSGLATGAGLWLGISAAISLFLGSYFSLRISNFITQKVGLINGLLIASVFFILMIWGAGSSIGSLSKGIGNMVGSLGNGAANLSTNPSIQDTIQKAIGSNNLKSNPSDVVQGLAVRLLQGDTESAKNYYAYQTGLSKPEVDSKVNQLKTDFDQAAKDAGEKAAQALADAGWSLFVMFIVGLGAAVVGGIEGSKGNRERPVAIHHSDLNSKRIQPIT